MCLTIEANGRGFDRNLMEDGGGWGLKNIQSRVSLLNGTLDIDSAVGRGTVLAVFVPTVDNQS